MPNGAKHHIWLPFEPLAHVPLPYDRSKLSATDYKPWRAYYRARAEQRVTLESADMICCSLLRRHPSEIYGDLYWAAPIRESLLGDA